MTSRVEQLIAALPKTELHLHIEGSLEPELMFKLAHRNNITIPYKSVEDVRAAYKFTNLQTFLDIYYAGASVLIHREDFADLAFEYMQRAHADNVVHTEVFFDPQTHTDRNIAFETVICGLEDGLKRGQELYGITFKIILCFLRHLPEEAGFKVWDMALPFVDKLAGVGLDSSELGFPPSNFERLFKACLDKGLKTVAHAGEEGPASYIWEALDLLKVSRVDHGVKCLTDEKLVDRLIAEKMPLTVCPNSNVCLCVFKDYASANSLELLRRGLKVMINSDDPAYFKGYLNQNYLNLLPLKLTEEETLELCINSIEASWLTAEEQKKHIDSAKKIFAEITAASN